MSGLQIPGGAATWSPACSSDTGRDLCLAVQLRARSDGENMGSSDGESRKEESDGRYRGRSCGGQCMGKCELSTTGVCVGRCG